MGQHIAQIGTGRVGRPTAYTIMCAGLAEKLTVCDIKANLAAAFAEELKHAAASLRLDVEVEGCEDSKLISNADIILISAGVPRIPGVAMSRRDLAAQNAKTVKEISEGTVERNPRAKYVVITNPVDAMAMVCKRYSDARFVIGTGTSLESLRLRSKLARELNTSVSKVQGFVGGEHGEGAVTLWSTVRVNGLPAEEYAKSTYKALNKGEIDHYIKSISKFIVDTIGGTEYGPAAAFRDIVRAIVEDSGEVLSVDSPIQLPSLPEPTFVSVPVPLGASIGSPLYNTLPEDERRQVEDSAKAIYQTYQTAVSSIEEDDWPP